jgi:hypothetical protein
MISSQQEQIVAKPSTIYASAKDFCRVFKENTNHLYLLSLLLTADEQKAEQCFLATLEECTEKNSVFKQWAYTWSRRTMIKNAVRMVSPTAQGSNGTSGSSFDLPSWTSGIAGPLAEVAHLQPFERFVYIISILEGYSDQECSLLLNCSRQDVTSARIRTLQHLPRVHAVNSATEFADGIPIPANSSMHRSRLAG